MISLISVPSFPVLHPLFRIDCTLVVEGSKEWCDNSRYNNKVGNRDHVVNLATDCLRNRHVFPTQTITGSNCGDGRTVPDPLLHRSLSLAPGSCGTIFLGTLATLDTTVVLPLVLPGQAPGPNLADSIHCSPPALHCSHGGFAQKVIDVM